MKYPALLLMATCSGALPLIQRPDTSNFVGLIADSTAVVTTQHTMYAAYPNEGSLCYTGVLRLAKDTGWVVELTDAVPALIDSVDEAHVWYQKSGPCPPAALAFAHSHPHSQGRPCSHSDPDAFVLMAHPHLLASLVLCVDGNAELLWQDGRRLQFRWLREEAEP